MLFRSSVVCTKLGVHLTRGTWLNTTFLPKNTESRFPRPTHQRKCVNSGGLRANQVVWVKCTTSAECKTIRIAVSAVMDVLAKPLKVRSLVLISKWFIKWFWISIQIGIWAGSLVIRGYPSPLIDECYLTIKLENL